MKSPSVIIEKANNRKVQYRPMPGKTLLDASFFEKFNTFKRDYSSEKYIRIYTDSSEKLWIDECERLKKLSQALILIACPKTWSVGKYVSSTKKFRTADKDTDVKSRFISACRKTEQQNQLQ